MRASVQVAAPKRAHGSIHRKHTFEQKLRRFFGSTEPYCGPTNTNHTKNYWTTIGGGLFRTTLKIHLSALQDSTMRFLCQWTSISMPACVLQLHEKLITFHPCYQPHIIIFLWKIWYFEHSTFHPYYARPLFQRGLRRKELGLWAAVDKLTNQQVNILTS